MKVALLVIDMEAIQRHIIQPKALVLVIPTTYRNGEGTKFLERHIGLVNQKRKAFFLFQCHRSIGKNNSILLLQCDLPLGCQLQRRIQPGVRSIGKQTKQGWREDNGIVPDSTIEIRVLVVSEFRVTAKCILVL